MKIPVLSPQNAEQLLQGHIAAHLTSWRVLKASGDGLRDYLQGQLTQDMTRLKPEQGIHACLLTAQGKAVSELFIIEAGGDELILLAPSHVAVECVARLRQFSLGYRLRIGIVESMSVFSLQGAKAAAQLTELNLPEPDGAWLASSRDAAGQVFALRSMQGQTQACWLIGEAASLGTRLGALVGEDQAEALRIIHGMPRFATEWDSRLHPLNANLIEFDGVSFDKGCYVGQEVTSRMNWRGGIKKKLYRVQLAEMQAEESPPLPWPVLSTQHVGEIRSAACDAAGRCFGIALLPTATADAGTALHLEQGEAVMILEPCHA